MNTTQQTYNQIAAAYMAQNSDITNIKRFIDKFLRYLKDRAVKTKARRSKKPRVLDVGCAGGRESNYLYKHGCEVTGIDFSEKFLDLAKKNYPECTFLLMDMRKLIFKDNDFDGIWANASLLHLAKVDAKKVVKKFFKILKPGGVVQISVMQGDFEGLRDHPVNNWPERFFAEYQPEELRSLIELAGFKVILQTRDVAPWGRAFLEIYATK